MTTLNKEWEEYRAARNNLVTYNADTNCIDIDTGINGYTYSVDASDLDDSTDALEWVRHLCEKKWMTTQKIKFFIEKISEIKHSE